MKRILISTYPALAIQLNCEGGNLTQTHLSIPEKEGFELLFDPAQTPDPLLKHIVAWLTLYAARRTPTNTFPLDYSYCSPFTQSVLAHLQTLPFGQSISYAHLAHQIQRPQAARAVGNACGANPFPLLIPCHRVLATGQKIGGFSCGAEIKKRLLIFEKIPYSSVDSKGNKPST